MSIMEFTKKENIAQEAKDKLEMEKLYSKLELLNSQLAFGEDKNFQDWMMIHVSKYYADAVKTHLKENDTNKSFRGKGEIKVYNRLLTWTQTIDKEISELKDLIYRKEKEFSAEELEKPNNHKPEN